MGEAKKRKEEIKNLKMEQNVAFKLRKELRKFITRIENDIEEGMHRFNAKGNAFKFSDENVVFSFSIGMKEASNMLNKVPTNKIHELITNEKFLESVLGHFTAVAEAHYGYKQMVGNVVNADVLACGQLAMASMVESVGKVMKIAA